MLGHHIVSVRACTAILFCLLFLTVVTVLAAQIDLGIFNFPLAMAIATLKAAFVVFIFMGLKYDSLENKTIFFSSFIFLGIFIILTLSDVMFREDSVYVKKESALTTPVKE